MTETLIEILASYLLGSLVGSLIVGRWRGVDIRQLGSGNAGGTNALRTQGKLFALGVMLIDTVKGFLATRFIAQGSEWLPVLCAMAVIVGHVYPVFFGFRGGKGMATALGAVLGIKAALLLPVLAVWLLVVAMTGFVGLASMTAAAALPLYVGWHGDVPRGPLLTLGCFIAAFVLFTHRANLLRMRAGTEPRFLRPRGGS